MRVKGTLADEVLDDRYAPALTFQLDPLQLRAGRRRLGRRRCGLHPEPAGQRRRDGRHAQHLRLGEPRPAGRDRPLGRAVGYLLAIAVALLTTIRERRRPQDLSMQIHARYGHLIVPIAAIMHDPAQPVVDVMSIDALAQVAERCERVILHHHRIGAESYLVDDEGTLYRYQPRAAVLREVAAA